MLEKRTSSLLVVKAIKACSSKKALNTVFKEYGISKLEQRIKLLLKAMGNPSVSYSDCFPPARERYNTIVDTHFSGILRKDYYSWISKGKKK
ncbi:MAG: hypothetical protein FWC26_08615 [Fibromonadales bacterium]|nr:hypothetical protein [Fibromonadales bacterium]